MKSETERFLFMYADERQTMMSFHFCLFTFSMPFIKRLGKDIVLNQSGMKRKKSVGQTKVGKMKGQEI